MFGVPYSSLDLALLPNYESEIPVVLTILHCYLRCNKGLEMEGIFRKNGREQTFLDAISRMDLGHCLEDIDCDCYIVGQLIKAFFREYQIAPPGFFTPQLLSGNPLKDNEIIKEFDEINEPLKSVLLWLIDLCVEVNNIESNKMSLESLSICFSPNLCRDNDPSQLLLLQRSSQSIFLRLCELRVSNELCTANNAFSVGLTHNAFSVSLNYRCSLSSGIYGSYLYGVIDERPRDVIHYESNFELKYIGDDDNNELDLTNEERVLVHDFGNLLSSRYNYENIAYSELVRFVIGCKLRISVAERRFLNLKKLEREYKLNDIELNCVRNELRKECYMLCGRDLKDNAIVGFRINKWNKKDIQISVMMKSLMVWIDSISSDLNVSRNGIVILLDMNGLNKDNMSLDLEKVFIAAFQDCYPMRIKQFIICDAPVLIRAVIQIAKLVLTKKLSSRIISVKSTANTGSLWQYVDYTQIPQCLNGGYTNTLSNAWQFVRSKVVGNIMEEKDNEMNELSDSDREYMKQKTLPFEKGNNKKIGKKMFNKISKKVSSQMLKAKIKIKQMNKRSIDDDNKNNNE